MHRLTGIWVETYVVWNNQPTASASAKDSFATPASAGCMTWATTTDVKAWVDGTANNGWRVKDAAEDSLTQYFTQFRTREDGIVPAEQPKLEMTYTS